MKCGLLQYANEVIVVSDKLMVKLVDSGSINQRITSGGKHYFSFFWFLLFYTNLLSSFLSLCVIVEAFYDIT